MSHLCELNCDMYTCVFKTLFRTPSFGPYDPLAHTIPFKQTDYTLGRLWKIGTPFREILFLTA